MFPFNLDFHALKTQKFPKAVSHNSICCIKLLNQDLLCNRDILLSRVPIIHVDKTC